MKKKIFIAGETGMLGSAIKEKLLKNNILISRKRKKLDLLNQSKVLNFFKKNKIDEVYICAAKVGGIYANSNFPANFIYENLQITTNIIHAAYLTNVKKVLYFGSSCIYPKANRPIMEKDLLEGPLEKTNEPYAIAKIAGLKLCQAYAHQYDMDIRVIIPNNLYGPGDNYDSKNSHVVAALIKKIHDAKTKNLKSVSLWGTGKPQREFLYVSDCASYSIRIMSMSKKKFQKITNFENLINLGSNQELSIKNLSSVISKVINYRGKILFNLNILDGVYRKKLNLKKQMSIGLKKITSIKIGIKFAYKDFLKKNNLKENFK
jgi:GDP-L-fucose synthase|tara:strand:- start:4682 stop:5638 length:957 start_codon:yes stop_codon:yes gene_type:complete